MLHCYSPWPKPRIVTLAANTTPEFLVPQPWTIVCGSSDECLCLSWVAVPDSLSKLTFSNHGLWLMFVTFYICILCHCSHFHSVGEQHHVISPRLILASTYTLSLHRIYFLLFLSLLLILGLERK